MNQPTEGAVSTKITSESIKYPLPRELAEKLVANNAKVEATKNLMLNAMRAANQIQGEVMEEKNAIWQEIFTTLGVEPGNFMSNVADLDAAYIEPIELPQQ